MGNITLKIYIFWKGIFLMERSTTRFFAAANTENGFFSLFDEIFSPQKLSRIYILKGGPGTGKSTLMKSIGFTAEAGGFSVDYFYCSSDTDSLDGILIREKGIAVLDGTAPHVTDPVYPGAVEQIINLGEAFDTVGLEAESEILKLLGEKKRNAYRFAYRYLCAAGALTHQIDEVSAAIFLREKARGAAQRLVLSLSHAQKGDVMRRFVSAIGTKGMVRLDTLEKRAKKIYAVTDKYGLGYTFMGVLYAELLQKGVAMTVCSAPLVRSRIERIYIEGEDVLFAVMTDEDATRADKIINVSRFADKDGITSRRAALRYLGKCTETLLEGALASLKEAGAYHEKTEAVYGKHIDFSVVDNVRNRLISEIFVNNT